MWMMKKKLDQFKDKGVGNQVNVLAWWTGWAQKSLGVMEYRCNDGNIMEVWASVEAMEEHTAKIGLAT